MEAKLALWGIVIVVSYVNVVKGIRCWTCNNAKSGRECLKAGRLQICQKGQEMSCQTEIRYGALPGNRPLIFKRCKQKMACRNDKRQNKDQCIDGRKDSVCRCCCRTNNCNRVNFWCRPIPDSKCVPLKTPKRGTKMCKFEENEGEFGSKCFFACKGDLELQGNRVSVCRSTKTGLKFSHPAPTCVPPLNNATRSTPRVTNPTTTTSRGLLTTSPLNNAASPTSKPTVPETASKVLSTSSRFTDAASPTETRSKVLSTTSPVIDATIRTSKPTASTEIPEGESTRNVTLSDCEIAPPAPTSGGYSCIRSRNEVICSYFCGEDETIVGPGVLTCRSSSGWNGTTPECVSECGDLPDNPVNGTRACTGDGGIGTTCTFLCDPGFELIGEESITCVFQKNRVIWSSSAPICESRKDIPK